MGLFDRLFGKKKDQEEKIEETVTLEPDNHTSPEQDSADWVAMAEGAEDHFADQVVNSSETDELEETFENETLADQASSAE
ncbi:signal recognition particle-docking protein FtsY, partial [Enterococcus faecalis]|nr:signal recognition particle-docking protein FtsY [Enterococcus faecalis]